MHQVVASWLAYDLLCCNIRDSFKEKGLLCDKVLEDDVVLTSFHIRGCLLIDHDVHQLRGHGSNIITDWERASHIEEHNPSKKFLLISKSF
jgi:hypothetical protein